MTMALDEPRLDCLPEAQRRLWARLGEVPDNFVLYGGTALALRLGHRASEDFDFFSSQPFDPDQLFASLTFLRGGKIEDKDANTLSVVLPDGDVKVSFFGDLSLCARPVFDPAPMDNGLSVASVGDVFGCKCAVVQKRAAFKDYFDISAILDMTDYTLADGLSFAAALYEDAFVPLTTLRALSYFDDLDHPLPEDRKALILTEVQGVDLNCLPVRRFKGQGGQDDER